MNQAMLERTIRSEMLSMCERPAMSKAKRLS